MRTEALNVGSAVYGGTEKEAACRNSSTMRLYSGREKSGASNISPMFDGLICVGVGEGCCVLGELMRVRHA